jgi:hypothetical protein
MPLIHAADLLDHARNMGYRVPAFELTSLDHIVPIVEAAEHTATPVILIFSAESGRSFAPALAAAVAAVRETAVPVVIEARTSPDSDVVACAIRGGANSILLSQAADTPPEQVETAIQLASASGVPLFVSCDTSMSTHYRDYRRLPASHNAAYAEAERGLVESSGNGRAAQALAACRHWREVEHLIVYNVKDGCDARFVGKMMAHGRTVLGAIPGVRRVFTGQALRRDDRYQYCWLVRFANPAVVASYRDHPDHVAFANTQFRPVAADRISIDFESAE